MKNILTISIAFLLFLLFIPLEADAQNLNDGRIRLRVWLHKVWSNGNCGEVGNQEYVFRDVQVRAANGAGGFDTSASGLHVRAEGDANRWYNMDQVGNQGSFTKEDAANKGFLLFDKTYGGTTVPTEFEWKVSEIFENDCGGDWTYEGSCGFLDEDDIRYQMGAFDAAINPFRSTPAGQVGYVQSDVADANVGEDDSYAIIFAYQWDWVDALPPLCSSPKYEDGPITLTVEYQGLWSDIDYDGGINCTFGLTGAEELRLRLRSRENVSNTWSTYQTIKENTQQVPQWNTTQQGTNILTRTYTSAEFDMEYFDLDIDTWEEEGCGSDDTYNTGCANNDDIRYQSIKQVNWRDGIPNTWNYLDIPLRNGSDNYTNWTVWIRYKFDIGTPTITSQATPADRVLCIGNPTTIDVETQNITYFQWQVADETAPAGPGCPASANWTDLPGENCEDLVAPQTPGTRIYRLVGYTRVGSGSTTSTGDRMVTVISDCVRVTYFPYVPDIQSTICNSSVLPNTTDNFSVAIPPDLAGVANTTGVQWSVVPSTGVTIATPTNTSTDITFTTPGSYTVTYTTSNGVCPAPDNETSATCIVSVSAADCGYVYLSDTYGNDINSGSPSDPVKTLQQALSIADGDTDRNTIRMHEGTYVTSSVVNMVSNVTVEGGYAVSASLDDWAVQSDGISTLNSTYTENINASIGHRVAIKSNNVANWILKNININTNSSPLAGQTTNGSGLSNYGIWISNTTGYTLENCAVNSGNATDGLGHPNPGIFNGSWDGSDGDPGVQGNAGTPSNDCGSFCDGDKDGGTGGAAGTGGASPVASGTSGGAGGFGGAGGDDCGTATDHCGNVSRTFANRDGARASSGNPGGGGAGGGTGGCGGNGQESHGSTGTGGSIGADGTDGANGVASYSIATGFFMPGKGADGTAGQGGGGGGGGGGGAWNDCSGFACADDAGNGGSGGGGGGGGGGAGKGAAGGGASFAIYEYNSTAAGITNSVFTVSTAGSAGVGGARGDGGNGGIARAGVTGCQDSDRDNPGHGGLGAAGGKGGNGGNGGNGSTGIASPMVSVDALGTATLSNPSTSLASYAVNVTANYNLGCTNSQIDITKTGGTWTGFGADGAFVNDVNSTTTSYTTSGSPVGVYYTSTGTKDLMVDATTYPAIINISEVRNLPTVDIANMMICHGDLVDLQSTPNDPGTTKPVGFEWYIIEKTETDIVETDYSGTSNYSTEDPGLVNIFTNTGTTPKDYVIRYRVKNDCCGWSIPIFKTITVNPKPEPVITGLNEACDLGGTITLDAGVFDMYQWDDAANSTTQTIDAGPGTYSVTVTDANGCQGVATKTVTETLCAAFISDPCVCLNNATTGADGQFGEMVEIVAPAGETWTITSVTGLFCVNPADADQAATVGTTYSTDVSTNSVQGKTFEEITPGRFRLSGVHVDANGYSLQISNANGSKVLSISNTCSYIDAEDLIVDYAPDCDSEVGVSYSGAVPPDPDYTYTLVSTDDPTITTPTVVTSGNFSLGEANTATFTVQGDSDFCISQQLIVDFTVDCTGGLPVELLDFSGYPNDRVNVLEWITSTEENTKYHIIERSVDGIADFHEVGRVDAAGSSVEEIRYSLEDDKPLGIAYYRLKTQDIDGMEHLSNVIVIKRGRKEFGFVSVFPNPTRNLTNIQFNALQDAEINIKLVDVAGRLVSNYNFQAVEGMNTHQLDMSTLANGVYIVKMNNGNSEISYRLVKQN